MSLQNFLVRCRMAIGDYAADKWLEPELVAYANEGKNELAKIIRQANEDFFETSTTGQMTATTAPNPTDITLPSDFARLKNIRITTSQYEHVGFVHLDHSDPRFDEALTQGDDWDVQSIGFFYDILGLDTLRLAPGTTVNLDYTLYYHKTIPDMALLSDTPVGIPTEHWDWIVTYMIREALRSHGDERCMMFDAKLQEQTGRMVDAVNQRQVREPEFVVGYLETEYWE